MLVGQRQRVGTKCVDESICKTAAGRSGAATLNRHNTKRHVQQSSHTIATQPPAINLSLTSRNRRQVSADRRLIACSASAAASWGDDSAAQPPQQSVDIGDVEIRGNATFSEAVFNVLNILLGIGLLSLPFALKQAGWVGLPIMAVMGVVCNYTGKTVGECIVTVSKRENKDLNDVGYEDVALSAFGKFGRAIVSATMYIELYGICCLLFIIMGDNLHYLLASRFGGTPASYMLAAAAAMIPTVWLPDVKSLSYLGFAGVGGILAVLATVVYTFFTGGFPAGASTAAVEWATMPVAFGCFAFCYAGHGVFPAIRASMKDVSKYPQVLNVAYTSTGAICSVMAGLGYYMYGTGVADIITLSLPMGLLATACTALILISPFSKFALCMEPFAAPANAFAAKCTPGFPSGLRRFFVRTGLAISCLVVARGIPVFSLLMALIGSVLTVNVSLIFPALCHLKLHKGEASTKRRVWNWIVILLGLLCMISGTYSSARSILASTTA